jgi:hypothetical protein
MRKNRLFGAGQVQDILDKQSAVYVSELLCGAHTKNS